MDNDKPQSRSPFNSPCPHVVASAQGAPQRSSGNSLKAVFAGAGTKVTEDLETSISLKIKELILLITGKQPKDACQILDLKKEIEKFLHLDGGVQQNTGDARGTVPVESDLLALGIPTEQYLDLEKQLVQSNSKLELALSTNAELIDKLAQLKQKYEEKFTKLEDTQERSLTTQLQLTLRFIEQLKAEKRDLSVLLEEKTKESDQSKVDKNQALNEKDGLLSRLKYLNDSNIEHTEFIKTQVKENRTLRLEICQLRGVIREVTLRDHKKFVS